MKFEELLYQPVRAPLEGFDKAVATGFEIAQNQERLRQNQEQIELKKQEIKDEFLTKGMNLMSILPKLKSSKQKNFYNGMMRTYFEKAGFDPQKIDSLFNQMDADEDLSVSFADYVSTLNKVYPNTVEGIQQKKIKLMEYADADEEQRKTISDDWTAQLKQLLAEQTMKAMTQETTKRKVSEEAVKSAAPMHVIDRVNQGDFGYANDWRMASDKIINARTSLKDAKFISPEQRSQLETQMNMAQAMIRSPETFQNGIMMADAVSVAAGEAISKSTQIEEVGKSKKAAAKTEKPSEIYKTLGSIREQAQKNIKDERVVVRSLDGILQFADKSGPLSADLLVALMDAIRSGKLNVLREGEMDRALASQGVYDKAEVFVKKWTGKKDPKLGPEIRKEYKEIAEQYKKVVTEQIANAYSPYIEQAKGIGATEDQIKKVLVDKSLHQYVFPEKQTETEKSKPFYPTPTGGSPQPSGPKQAESTPKLKIPTKEFVEEAKKKNPKNWIAALEKLGYDTRGL